MVYCVECRSEIKKHYHRTISDIRGHEDIVRNSQTSSFFRVFFPVLLLTKADSAGKTTAKTFNNREGGIISSKLEESLIFLITYIKSCRLIGLERAQKSKRERERS